jgi:SAM-dependent methyltransferase
MAIFKTHPPKQIVNWLRYFGKWAKNYEGEVEGYGYDPKKLIEPFLGLIGKTAACLDVGCGTGKGMEALRELCKTVAGVEPVEGMAKKAEEKGFEVLRMKGEEIGKLGRKFELISFFASIDFIDAKKAAKGCRKIIGEGGKIFMTIEPQNEKRVLETFEKEGFRTVKKTEARAYRGHDYVCVLLGNH